MFSIGDFARHGSVSVRMLRHYDALGLLRPARVDEDTGYRSYDTDQLATLNRVVVLKDLGFTLRQIGALLDDAVDSAELRGMLRLRRAELQTRMAEDAARLTHVEARIRMIESEGHMPDEEIRLKSVPAVRVAELSGIAEGYHPSAIGPVVQPLCAELGDRIHRAGLTPTGPLIAHYADAEDGRVRVHAAIPVSAEVGDVEGMTIRDLPALEKAAAILHHGSMDEVMGSLRTLARWIEAHGYRSAGAPREVYLDIADGDCSAWVTELQEPLATT